MTHEFFRAKHPWSRYKDFILSYYLDPYIPKVAKLKKPILIVDCFAGCGTFGDKEPGSPLIIAGLAKKWRDKGIDVRVELIEADPENFQSLMKCVQPFTDFATVRHGSFEDHLPGLAQRAKQDTVFLYIDPYTVKGLDFERLKAVYDQIHQAGASVEMLLNFNVATFMRWGLAAVKRLAELPSEELLEADYLADDPTERVEMTTLDSIAGGACWRTIALNPEASFQQKIGEFARRYLARLAETFAYAAAYEVKEKYEHLIPKYLLIYGTRHPDGLELMNDGMCKARKDFLGAQFVSNMLFDCTPDEEKPDTTQLKKDLQKALAEGIRRSRKDLRIQALRSHFCKFQSKDINAAIGELLKAGLLFSVNGKTRINDDMMLGSTPFALSGSPR